MIDCCGATTPTTTSPSLFPPLSCQTGNFTFGRGGNQGARGADTGGDWAIENVLEELDAPGEFYFDEASRLLYLFHNASGPPPAEAEFVVPKLRNLLNLTGTQWGPVCASRSAMSPSGCIHCLSGLGLIQTLRTPQNQAQPRLPFGIRFAMSQ
eukprot:scaffold20574_cov34-Tisochrysis_lutea.AAC.3